MAAATRITHPGTADLLADLAYLVRNPDAIEKAHKELQAQSALTECELKKLDEARAFMSSFDALATELSDMQKATSTASEELAKRTSAFESERLASDAQHRADAAALDARTQALAITERELAEKTDALKQTITTFEQDRDKRVAKLDALEAMLTRWEQELSDAQAKLRAKEEELRDRVQQARSMFGL